MRPIAPKAADRYVELRTHSAFSFLRGASLPEDLIGRAAALGHSAIALGDRNGVYGAPRFHQAAKAAGVRAIVGCELQVEEKGLGGSGVEGLGEEDGKPSVRPIPNPQPLNPITPSLYVL